MLTDTTAPPSVLVPGRCNGPVGHGNGGYSCGVFATLIDGPAEVSLRRPVPVDVRLDVQVGAGDREARVLHGDTLVAEVRPAPAPALDVPRVLAAEAREASLRYRGSGIDAFSHCFVCGPRRADAFGVFAAPVGDRPVVASPWTPSAWVADDAGGVLAEHVWAALDCPTYFAANIGEPSVVTVLARMRARLDAPVVAGAEHVVVAWPLATDGRKRHAASAVLAADGRVLAVAQVVLVQIARPAGT